MISWDIVITKEVGEMLPWRSVGSAAQTFVCVYPVYVCERILSDAVS